MADCLNLSIPQVSKDLKELTSIFKDENIAYYLLSENNGYSLDKDKNGNPSSLFKELSDTGLNKKQSVKEKAIIYSSDFKSYKSWTLKEPSLKDLKIINKLFKTDTSNANAESYNNKDVIAITSDTVTNINTLKEAIEDSKSKSFIMLPISKLNEAELNYRNLLLDNKYEYTELNDVGFYTKKLEKESIMKKQIEGNNIIVNGVYIDFNKLGLDFKLTQDQSKSVQEMADWIDGKELKQKLTENIYTPSDKLKAGEVYVFSTSTSIVTESVKKAVTLFGRDKTKNTKGFQNTGIRKQTYGVSTVEDITKLYDFANNNPKAKFLIGVTDINEAQKFVDAGSIPANIKFTKEFLKGINNRLPNQVKDNFLLTGYAGTGKTTVMAVMLEYLKKTKQSVIVSATTDKAVGVQKRIYGNSIDAITLHSALGLAPDIAVEEFDVSKLNFKPLNNPKVGFGDILFIDEASMINTELYKFLKKHSSDFDYKILFIGDDKQLKPVKQKTKSEVFNLDDKYTSSLITQVRQASSNSLGNTLVKLRRNQSSSTEPLGPTRTSFISKDKKEGIEWVTENGFIQSIKDVFSSDSYKKDANYATVIAYKNDTVSYYNNYIRKLLGRTEEIEEGELMIGYSKMANFDKAIIKNSAEYIVTKRTNTKRTLYHPLDATIQLEVSGIEVEMKESSDENISTSTFIVSKNNSSETKIALAKIAYETLQEYYKLRGKKDRKQKSVYGSYKQFLNSFVTFENLSIPGISDKYGKPVIHKKKAIDYGYAITSHKSQGSTYDYVFVDETDIDSIYNYDVEGTNQSKYVSLSRASKGAIVKTKAKILSNESFVFDKTTKGNSETLSLVTENSDTVEALIRDGIVHKDCK